uniref:Histone domain-containing protein n=1 Tax=Elaeophora elaphi TaxID=1147741 RepID=A0A0R3RXG8_9BILA
MTSNSGMTRRASNRIRKVKRSYSPSADDDSSHVTPSTSRKIREPRNISLDNLKSLCNSSARKVISDGEHGTMALNHNSFWNFAITLSHPIVREKITSDGVITLLLREVSRAIRQLIFGAKLVMQQAERQKLLCDDLNTFIEREGGKLLFGFTEDNKWRKIGDVFVPNDEVVDLRFCSSSVQLETISGR